MVSKGNEKYLHHWLFYECSKEFENWSYRPKAQNCFKLDAFQAETDWWKVEQKCRKISLTWGVGGYLKQDFPENLAYPLGGSDSEFKYFYLQIHYDNPQLDLSKILILISNIEKDLIFWWVQV